MATPFTKKGFARLAKPERGRFMYLHMSQGQGGASDYLPEDCSECCACSTPILGIGGGFCETCYAEYDRLYKKALGQ